MGDITIYLLLDCSLLDKAEDDEVAPSLPSAPAAKADSSSFQLQSFTHSLPADSSLAELMDSFILSKINLPPLTAAGNEDEKRELLDRLTILDVSYNPAKIISPIVRQYTQVSGPNSKTLQSLGWYPSGKLVILPSPVSSSSQPASTDGAENARTEMIGNQEQELLGRFLQWQSRNVLQDEEFAYNNPDAANKHAGTSADATEKLSSSGVQWTGVGATTAQGNATTTMKPSEIFNAVEQRSENEELAQLPTTSSTKPKKKKPKRTEQERTKRLDTLLQNLDSKSKGKKKKAVSEKVRRMLLKSRSEGNKKLRMEDRFHLEVVRLYDVSDDSDRKPNNKDESGDASYRFFSRQTTAGRVASTVAPNLGNARASELLVLCNSQDQQKKTNEKRYRRLPNTMSLHDAQRAGWVKEFGVVIVRIYSLATNSGDEGNDERVGPSKSVLDPDSDVEMESNNDDGNEGENQKGSDGDTGNSSVATDVEQENKGADQKQSNDQQQLQQNIHTIFMSLEENNNKKKKKKPASKQMQNVLIKSKSSGNARLKQEERIYLEVIVFHDNGTEIDIDASSSSAVSSCYRFFSKQNNLQHIISVSCGDSSNDADARIELIVVQPSNNKEANVANIYRSLSTELSLGDAIQNGFMEDYGRVLIRVCNGKCESCLPF